MKGIRKGPFFCCMTLNLRWRSFHLASGFNPGCVNGLPWVVHTHYLSLHFGTRSHSVFYLPILLLILLIQGLLCIVQGHKKPVDHRHGDVVGAHVDG